MRPKLSLPAIYIVIGIIVAALYHFFDHVGSLGGIISLVLAVLLWPLILLGIKISIVI